MEGSWWGRLGDDEKGQLKNINCLTSPASSPSYSLSRHPCVETSSCNQNFFMD